MPERTSVKISPATALRGVITAPADKSISHRALLLCALSSSGGTIENLSGCEAVGSTLACLQKLGVGIERSGKRMSVKRTGPGDFFCQPKTALDCGGSATTMRLLMGALAGQPVTATLTGNASLRARTMEHVAKALREMGAEIETTNGGAPVFIKGRSLRGMEYTLCQPSAQLKSAIILSALAAQGKTNLREPIRSRDHTEKLLALFGYPIKRSAGGILIQDGQPLNATRLTIPGDLSSAAFFIAAACIIPGSRITVRGTGINPTRMGFIKILKKMGADIKITRRRGTFEPVGDITACYRELKGVTVRAGEIPSLIDEIPLLAIVAAKARGTTVIEGLDVIRTKESDRLKAIAHLLLRFGVPFKAGQETLAIFGPSEFKSCEINSFGDHRIVMAATIAALAAEGPCKIHNPELAAVSYPDFYKHLRDLTRRNPARLTVIGHPVKHSLSPRLFTLLGRSMGRDVYYTACDVKPANLAAFIIKAKKQQLKGFNVTMPLKEIICGHIDVLDAPAKAIGAVNTVKLCGDKTYATNTDETALRAVLKAHKIKIKDTTAVIFGTGGAAKATAYVLCENEASAIHVISRRRERGMAFVSHFKNHYPRTTFISSASPEANNIRAAIWVNATPLGMSGKTLEKPLFNLPPARGACAVDWVYGKTQTPFIKSALKSRMKTIGGLEIFLEQALAGWQYWFGGKNSAAADRTIRQELTEALYND